MWIWTWSSVQPDPLQLALDRPPPRRLLALVLFQPGPLLLKPAGVVALIRDPPPSVELEDPAGDVVEEVAIVGHRDDGPLVVVEVALEPPHRLRIQVVGRLVEQQQVRLAQQQPAQCHPAALAARERRHLGVGRRAAERVHRDLERRLEVPAVYRVDLLLHPRELVSAVLRVVHRQLVEAVEQRAGSGHTVLDVAAHILGGIQRRLLFEQSDRGAGSQLCVAVELRVPPSHDPEQARLARPVVAEDADLGAREKGQRDVLQDLLVRRIAPGQAVRGEDVLRRHSHRG
jgi:hypothetical protein